MRHHNSVPKWALRLRRSRSAPAGLAKGWIIPSILGVLLVMPQFASAYSFAGSDWLVNLTGYVNAPLGLSQPISQTNVATTITQSSVGDIVLPLNIPPPVSLTFNIPGTVSGTHINFDAVEAGPIVLPDPYTYVRVSDITAHLEGEATSINPSDTTGGFGGRAYEITGYPTGGTGGTSWLTVDTIEVNLGFGWVPVSGGASIDVYSWSATRGEGVVPEPGSLAMLLGLAASLAGYCCWKRRGSR